MMYDIGECIESDFAFSDIGVSVFLCTACVFTVVDMEDGYLVFSQKAVEIIDDFVEVMYDIVAAVMGMACIEADA